MTPLFVENLLNRMQNRIYYRFVSRSKILTSVQFDHTPLTVFLCRCPSPVLSIVHNKNSVPRNLVYVRSVYPSDLAFRLSFHRHSYIYVFSLGLTLSLQINNKIISGGLTVPGSTFMYVQTEYSDFVSKPKGEDETCGAQILRCRSQFCPIKGNTS